PEPSDGVGARKESSSTPKTVRSICVPSSVTALTIATPIGVAASTSGWSRHAASCSPSTTERENALSVLVPSSKAKAVTGRFLRPETPSLTRPPERPDSMTMSTAIRAITTPMRPNRPRAWVSSRTARNTGTLGVAPPRAGRAGRPRTTPCRQYVEKMVPVCHRSRRPVGSGGVSPLSGAGDDAGAPELAHHRGDDGRQRPHDVVERAVAVELQGGGVHDRVDQLRDLLGCRDADVGQGPHERLLDLAVHPRRLLVEQLARLQRGERAADGVRTLGHQLEVRDGVREHLVRRRAGR